MSCAAAFGEGVRFGLAVDTPKTAMTLRRAVHDLTPLHLVLVIAQRDDTAEQVSDFNWEHTVAAANQCKPV